MTKNNNESSFCFRCQCRYRCMAFLQLNIQRWEKNSTKNPRKKLFERSTQQANVGVCRQNGNIIKKNILAFRILVLHNNQRCATISALLHIDLNINTSIFIILIANVISKWLVHAQRACISALVVPFYQTGEQKKYTQNEECSLIPFGHKVATEQREGAEWREKKWLK